MTGKRSLVDKNKMEYEFKMNIPIVHSTKGLDLSLFRVHKIQYSEKV